MQQSLSNIYNTLESTIKAMDDVPGLMDQFTQIVGSYSQQQLQAYIKFTEAREMLNNYEQQLADAKQQYEDAKQKAMENSDVAKMLDINTLAQLIYAQNFSMPAGYVKDSSNKSWLLKVGEEYDSIEDISGALLLHVDGFGDVRLSDVADVQIIDNAEDSFTRLNGERSVVLKIFKSNSSSAGEVSGNCKAAFKELEQKYDGLHVVVLLQPRQLYQHHRQQHPEQYAHRRGPCHHRAGHLPQGYQAHAGGRHQYPAVGAVCRGAHVLHRPGYEYYDVGGPVPRHWYAGGQLHRRHREHLPSAQPRRARCPRGGSGHQAGGHGHHGFHPHLCLRVPARHLHLRCHQEPAAAHVHVHRLLSGMLPSSWP